MSSSSGGEQKNRYIKASQFGFITEVVFTPLEEFISLRKQCSSKDLVPFRRQKVQD